MKEHISNIETLEQLIEEHKNCKTKVKIYEFDDNGYTLLLIKINKILKENQKLKQQLVQRDNIINKAREFINEYEKNRNCFKWNEQDYIDTINEIKEILNIDKGDE